MVEVTQELLPCPFCGGEAATIIRPAHSGPYVLCKCLSAGAQCDTEAEAITAWNTRHQPQPSAEQSVAKIVAWLLAKKGTSECRIANGDYIEGSTSHGEGLQEESWALHFASAIQRGDWK